MVVNTLPADSPPPHTHTLTHTRPWGSKGQNSTFSEHGHVAYQIEGNHKCSNVSQMFCLQNPLLTLRVGSNGQNSTFS